MKAWPLLVVVAAAGCTMPLRGDWSLPARAPLDTVGGRQLWVDDGNLVSRARRDDIEGALGVILDATPDGLRVVSRLAASTPLREQDLIVGASPVPPGDAAPITTELAAVRPRAHPVRSLEDIRGYALCPNRLDLLVRRGAVEEVVRLDVAREEPVATPRWDVAGTHELGLELCRVSDLPPDLRPVHAVAGRDLLVLRVEQSCELALRGLRPLDVIVGPFERAYQLWAGARNNAWTVLGPRGAARTLDFSDPGDVDDVPFCPLVEVHGESGLAAVRVLDLMWLAAAFRHTVDWSYEYRTDTHEVRREWSVLNVLFASLVEVETEDGELVELQVGPLRVFLSPGAE